MKVIDSIIGNGVNIRVVNYGIKEYEVQLKINNRFETIDTYRSENVALEAMKLEYEYYRN